MIIKGFSEKKDGNMSDLFGYPNDVMKNQQRFLAKKGVKETRIFTMKVRHGTKVEEVSSKTRYSVVEADAIWTREPNILLSFAPADCFPVYLWNENYIALIHAGRMGVLEKLVIKTILTIAESVDIFPSTFAIGPGIGPCCYVFQKAALWDWGYKILPHFFPEGRVDLRGAILKQIFDFEEDVSSIFYPSEFLKECTVCVKDGNGDFKYFSHRRAKLKGEEEGRNIAFIVNQI